MGRRVYEVRLLHVRGGVSRNQSWFGDTHLSSPRPWRCFLKNATKSFRSPCLLHVRGGVSPLGCTSRKSSQSSPRPWRCFLFCRVGIRSCSVFSTSVEVFPLRWELASSSSSLLHVRGGVSPIELPKMALPPSSPRPWRCFRDRVDSLPDLLVFSTSVEVFPRTHTSTMFASGLLHVRGGVSIEYTSMLARSQSSPRPWRCFPNDKHQFVKDSVFSTSVEVFLAISGAVRLLPLLLHVRGGVSQASRIIGGSSVSSPRPWRCFFESQCFCEF